jgi:hypothetical protein
MLSKMRYVTIEKWEGPCWDACLANQAKSLPCDPACHEEEHQLATLKAVKLANPNIPMVFYLNAMLDFNFLNLHAQYAAADALLRNTDGSVCHLTNDAGMVSVPHHKDARRPPRIPVPVLVLVTPPPPHQVNVTVYDFTQETGRALWVDTVRNLTATGLVDGIYADQMQVYAEVLNKTAGTWGLCKKR